MVVRADFWARTVGLLRDLWGGSRATKTNSEEKGSKEAYAVDDRAEQFEDDTPDINQLQSELAAMQVCLGCCSRLTHDPQKLTSLTRCGCGR